MHKIGGEVRKCDILMLYHKMCQHLEDFYNSINFSSNEECMSG